MSDFQDNTEDRVETADALEAVAVFRSWKNLFLSILLLCLILIQVVFWLVDTGLMSGTTKEADTSPVATPVQEPNITAVAQALTADANQADPNRAASMKAVQSDKATSWSGFSDAQLAFVLRVTNGVAILAAILFCAALLFSIALTVVGRLGGIQHISRAFFLSLVLLVLLIPWQTLFDAVTVGVLFNIQDVVDGRLVKAGGLLPAILYYLRFCGYWLAAIVLLWMSQVRCARWSKSMLRRMEMI